MRPQHLEAVNSKSQDRTEKQPKTYVLKMSKDPFKDFLRPVGSGTVGSCLKPEIFLNTYILYIIKYYYKIFQYFCQNNILSLYLDHPARFADILCPMEIFKNFNSNLCGLSIFKNHPLIIQNNVLFWPIIYLAFFFSFATSGYCYPCKYLITNLNDK